MPNTKGDLAPATIENLATHDKVYCMFNPNEYTLSKTNQFSTDNVKGKNTPKVKFSQGGAEELKLQLFFDTYAEGTDVRKHTQTLWKMMMVSDEKKNQTNNKSEPPHVAFDWGAFHFEAVIKTLSQKFTLFLEDGTPVRTTVDVTFQQVEDKQDHHGQNPTSGGGPPIKTHIVQAEDRLDLIAAKVYGDPTQWRLIARENGLVHPLRLREGQQLVIPALE
jgi:nucleoid-associated protein YgaU